MLNHFKNLYSIYYKETDPFNKFENTYSLGKINTIKEHGCVILWGRGEDISPLYITKNLNSQVHHQNHQNEIH